MDVPSIPTVIFIHTQCILSCIWLKNEISRYTHTNNQTWKATPQRHPPGWYSWYTHSSVPSARLSKPSTSKVICLHGIFCSRYGYQRLLPPKKGLQFWINSSSSGRCFTRHSSWSHQMVSCDQNSCWRLRQLEAWSSLASGFVYLYIDIHIYIDT